MLNETRQKLMLEAEVEAEARNLRSRLRPNLKRPNRTTY